MAPKPFEKPSSENRFSLNSFRLHSKNTDWGTPVPSEPLRLLRLPQNVPLVSGLSEPPIVEEVWIRVQIANDLDRKATIGWYAVYALDA